MNRLLVILLLSLSSLQAYAETKTYDFSTRTGGVDAFVYLGSIRNNSFPPSNNQSPSSANFSYDRLEAYDFYWLSNSASSNQYRTTQRYVFILDEAESEVSRLDISWIGYAWNYHNSRQDGMSLYIWNYDSGSYQLIQNSGDTENEITISGQITNNIAQYLGGTNDNEITLLAASNDRRTGNRNNIIWTDYLKIDATITPVNPAPFTCDVGNSYPLTASDNFSNTLPNWQATNFNRTISNWPGESLYNTPGQQQNVVYTINNDLSIDGANEYGMVEYDLVADDIDASSARNYSIYTNLDTNSGSTTNNDAGIVFGYQNDSNYYLARWTAFGTTYQSSSSYPGTYRSFDLIKVSGGVATELDSRVMDLGDRTSIMVVATDDGVAICTGSYGAAKADMHVALYTTETVSLHSLGLYSYDNDIGIDYDNFELRCQDCLEEVPEPYLNMQMEQQSWDGTTGEVIDETGNFNGTAINGATTDGTSPALAGDPGTCRYGEFDGINDYIQLPDSFENLTGSFTITAWINPRNQDRGQRILADDENNTRGYAFSLGDPGNGRLRFYSRGVSPISVDTQSAVVSTNTWTFVTAVHNAETKTREIYVNGIRQDLRDDHRNTGQALTYSGNWGTDSGFASIGGETNRGETGNRFTGNIDEVRVYKSALTSAQINGVYAETHPCANSFELFKIEHDSQGLTCQSEPVTITACTDATCNSIDSSVNTSVVLALGNGDTQTVNIVNGEGTAATSTFNYTDTTTPAELSLTSDFLCSNTNSGTTGTSGEPCQVNFATTGFVFSHIGDQTSGEDFPSITVQALADEGGVCTALVSDTTTIQMAMQYQIPTTPTANIYDIGGTTIAAQSGAPTSYSNVSLNFDNTGTAILPTNRYDDAGRINLHARFVVPASGNNPAVTVVGSSNLFWVKPAAINIDSNKIDVSASDRSDKKFPAGDSFDFSLTAVNAQGGTTYNYIPNDVEILVQRLLPYAEGSVDGSFNYGSGAIESKTSNDSDNFEDLKSAIFIKGKYVTSSAFFTEVGVIAIDARERNYADLGEVINAKSIRLNRFTPKYFTQTVIEHGSVVGEEGCSNWHYSGQPGISYGDIPQLTITAKNRFGVTTQNYRDFGSDQNFLKLADDDIDITEPSQDLKNGKLGTPYLLSASIKLKTGAVQPKSGSKGVYTYDFNMADRFTYTRNTNAVMPPFTAEFDLVITGIEDGDLIKDGTRVLDPSDISKAIDSEALENIEIRSNVEIRFGRLVLENSFGPETDEIPQPVRTEYLISREPDVYQINQEDNCTVIGNTATDWSFTESDTTNSDDDTVIKPNEVSIHGSEGKMAVGEYSGVLLRSDHGKIGSVTATYATPDWLKFDWDGDGNYDNDAEAVVTFGRFRGNDRIIYWQEIAN